MTDCSFERRVPRALAFMAAALLCVACVRAPQARYGHAAPTVSSLVATCERCSPDAMAPEVNRAIEQRIADLASRGQSCAVYGEVLERSYRQGRIRIRPYMWRVGPHLVSGEASADGEMLLAREIDSLNVGLRTIDDLMRTMEHEAVHIALNIPSRDESNEVRVNAFMRECSAPHTGDAAGDEVDRGSRAHPSRPIG